MPFSRRRFLICSIPAALTVTGCRKTTPEASRPRRPDVPPPKDDLVSPALTRAVDFLLSRQSADGTWKSDVYGPFKFGDALTPLCLNPILETNQPRAESIAKASAWLAAFAKDGASIAEPKFGFEFTTYTAALSVMALSHAYCGEHRKARDVWLNYLKERQLTEALGWTPKDREYGGWGYCRVLPRKPKAGDLVVPLLESNLSATAFALAALQEAGVSREDPLYGKARRFIQRCQNWAETKEQRDPSFDDGGFHFIYDDPVRNKAGMAGTDRFGRERFHSYGSTTADGIRALDSCGRFGSDDYRAAEAWMRRHFRHDRHPGRYGEKREMDREAVFYYYAASLSQTRLPPWTVRAHGKEMSWKQALIEELLKRQKDDGSWANRAHAVREDDPLNATSMAVIALANLSAPQEQHLPAF